MWRESIGGIFPDGGMNKFLASGGTSLVEKTLSSGEDFCRLFCQMYSLLGEGFTWKE